MSATTEPTQGASGSELAPSAESIKLPQKPNLAATLGYSLANLGYGMFYALNNAVLTLFLQRFTHSNVLLGLMGSSHSVEGAVIQPVVGAASDRLRTRIGRRRPFMLLFTPISALFLLLTPLASHLAPGVRLAAMVACIFLFTVSFNMAQDPYQALMPDVFPEPQRGRVTGIWMFVGVLGQASLVLLPIPLALKFTLVAIAMLVTTGVTCLLTREPKHPAESEKLNHWQELREAVKGLRTLRQAAKVLLGLFFSGIGIGAVLPFLTLFVKKITHCNDQSAQQMFLVLMAATALGVLPFGWVVDRVGSKRVLILGLALIGVAAFNGLWVLTLTQVALVLALAGLGNAAQSASAYPLLTQVVPHEEVGFYTGLQSTALSIAAPVTAIITGHLVDKGGYRWIFAVCAVSILLSLLVLMTLRLDRAAAEITLRDREQGRPEKDEG